MKLVDLNVCIKIDNTDKVIEFLKQQDADIIVLQEVMNPLDDRAFKKFRSKEDIDNALSGDYPYGFFGPFFRTDMHKREGKITKDFGGMAEQGNAIMSIFPILSSSNEHFYKKYDYQWDFTNFGKGDDHPRSLVIAELDIGGKRLQILNIHGLWSKDKRDTEMTLSQCRFVIEAASRKDMATIILGDFNLVPDTEGIRMLSSKFKNLIDEFKITSTIPHCKEYDEKPNMVLDYVFVNDKVDVKSLKAIDTCVSDHMPLILEFEIKDKK